ncbi:hypothetical protein BDN72DRAFT_848451, partial [Pluteus cervinus]
MSSKKRKLSGLDGLQLRLAYDRLLRLQQTFMIEEGDEKSASDSASQGFEAQIEETLQLMLSRLEGLSSFNFSSAAEDSLRRLKIHFEHTLELAEGYKDKAATAAKLGSDKLWSAKHFHDHLYMLQGHVARSNEACARTCIDAFMFRAAAMLPNDKYVVLNMEHRIAPLRVSPNSLTSIGVGGFVDYTALVSDQRTARIYLKKPVLNRFKKSPPGLFVVEAKYENLSDQVAQAICEMYACAKELSVKVIRGAITSGYRWIFLHLTLNENGEGGRYYESSELDFPSHLDNDGNVNMKEKDADLITAIVAAWMEHGLSAIEKDDFFTV